MLYQYYFYRFTFLLIYIPEFYKILLIKNALFSFELLSIILLNLTGMHCKNRYIFEIIWRLAIKKTIFQLLNGKRNDITSKSHKRHSQKLHFASSFQMLHHPQAATMNWHNNESCVLPQILICVLLPWN